MAGSVDGPAVDTSAPCTAPDVLLRDPATGVCRLYESNACGGPGAGIASPEYPPCTGACEGLGEQACAAHAGCQTAYVLTGAGRAYEACWEMGMAWFEAPACDTLDPMQCLGRKDCASVHAPGDSYHCEVPSPVPIAKP